MGDTAPLLQLAPALGGFALATKLAGYLYDKRAAAQGHHHNCTGHQCFRCAAFASLLDELRLDVVGLCTLEGVRENFGRFCVHPNKVQTDSLLSGLVLSFSWLSLSAHTVFCRPAFLMCAVLCLFSAAAATVLHIRMRSLYLAARRPHTV